MREAITYADFAKTQEVYLKRELVTGVSAYYIAIIDWFSAPKVLEINVDTWTGKPGQTIRVKARDNVGVAGVSVVIRDWRGTCWKWAKPCKPRQAAPGGNTPPGLRVAMEPFPSVEAIAWDLPGNCDSFTIS